MIYIYGSDINLRIVYKDDLLTEEEKSKADYATENLPTYTPIEGKIATLCLKNGQLFYLYKDKPTKPTKFDKLQKLVNEGKITQEEMNELL